MGCGALLLFAVTAQIQNVTSVDHAVLAVAYVSVMSADQSGSGPLSASRSLQQHNADACIRFDSFVQPKGGMWPGPTCSSQSSQDKKIQDEFQCAQYGPKSSQPNLQTCCRLGSSPDCVCCVTG